MDPEQVRRALEIVDQALELHGAEREAYLRTACGEDASLRREVLDYLRFDTTADKAAALEIPSTSSPERRYDIGEEISRGGIGVVHRAYDRHLQREIAMETLREEARDDPDVIRRFVRDARVRGELQHPGIAPVYDIGRIAEGHLFIAMKLVAGETLASLLDARSHPTDDQRRFLGIFEQICQTVAFAQSRGVVHRNLSTMGVIVGEFGDVQVMEWGTASLSGEARSDTRTDVFSLGAILFEILTGSSPHRALHAADGAIESADGRVQDALFSRMRQAGASEELAHLAAECLDLDPAKRPTGAREVSERVSRHLESV